MPPNDITATANQYRLDPRIFAALVKQESGNNQNARSPAGAIGRTQLMPATARALGVNPNDPQQNLEGGAKYLRQQLDAFGGNYAKALAAYNAGPGAVQKYGGVPPFKETQNYVKTILGAAKTGPSSSASSPAPAAPAQTMARTVGGVDNSQARAAAVSQFLGSKSSDPVDFAMQIRGLQDTPGQKATSSAPTSAPSASSASVGSSRALKRADAIAKQKLPYQWGGGHQAGGAAPGQPLDCSGAVSKVLGINPRVSGEFGSWGQPGDGGNSGVTVYSNSKHVLMKIDGHFWGTSASNPGGGAGWIKADQISPQYLSGFTARHSQ